MTDPHAGQERPQPAHDRDGSNIRTGTIHRHLGNPAWLARAAGVGLEVVSIVFVALFLFVLETAGELTLFTRTPPMQVALVLPYLVAVLTLGTTVGAALAWRDRYWSLAIRIHQSMLAILGLAFCWQLWQLGFLGF